MSLEQSRNKKSFFQLKQKTIEILDLTRMSSTRRKKNQKLTEERDDREHLEIRFTGTKKFNDILCEKKAIPALFTYDVKCKKSEPVMLLFILKVKINCMIETSISK